MPGRPRNLAPNAAYLTFRSAAFQFNRTGGHNERHFNALCGDDPPTITDGYAKWNVIDRPLRQGVTVPAGYNPARLKINIRFGIWDGRFDRHGWDTSAKAADEVESDIDDLHWMAGGNALAGPSPAINVNSYRVQGGALYRTHLIPRPYWGIVWVIDGGVEWGKAYRLSRGTRAGSRVYQEAAFTLLGYNSFGVTPPNIRTNEHGGYFTTTSALRTALEIAGAPSGNTPEALIYTLAGNICASNKNNPCRGTRLKLERRSISFPIPVNTAVWVPSHAI